MQVDLSVGLQRPLGGGWDQAKPCRNCGALVFGSPLCAICSGFDFAGMVCEDWPAVVPT